MTPAESGEIINMLAKAYPRFDMPEGSVSLYQELLAGIDYRIAYRAALEWVKDEKWFPTVADLREYARKTKREVEAEDWAEKAVARKEPEPVNHEIPEWVQVWWWDKNQTLLERQAANTTCKAPVAERPPVKVRDFPQLENPHPADRGPATFAGADAYSFEEYEQIRAEWVTAGSPRVSAVEVLAL